MPFYTKDFLTCCIEAKNILWIIHSDQQPPLSAKNIKWEVVENPTELIQKALPDVSVPDRIWQHKLCDLKPFWPQIFGEPETDFYGWCDWDVVHDLRKIPWDFSAAKFTPGLMASPLFLQRTNDALTWYPLKFPRILQLNRSVAWDEMEYLPLVQATVLQDGMTPYIDLCGSPRYAIHLGQAKNCPQLYHYWRNLYPIGK